MNTHDVVIAWCSPGHTTAAFTSSIAAALLDHRVRDRICDAVACTSGPLVAAARNVLVREFLATDAEWLLMLDADMVFRPDAVLDLLVSADPIQRPIVGGLCLMTRALGEGHAEAGWFRPDGLATLKHRIASGLIQVDYVGTGAMLAHRSVYERLAELHHGSQPWFQEVERDGRVDGEDYEFCRRATTAGFPIHVNADVRIGHVRTFTVYPLKETTP